MDDFAPSVWWLEGELHWIDNLGGTGLVLALGGVTAEQSPTIAGQTLVPYDSISFFNPLTRQWQTHTATGDITAGRRRACSVGVPGDDGTYEIFLYGGDASATDYPVISDPLPGSLDLGQVWVLSISSFRWHRAGNSPSQARFAHTCRVPGNPPRQQMLVVGGVVPGVGIEHQPVDKFPQGLGIYDLTQLRWVNSYNSEAAQYQTPKIVKDSIASNGSYPRTWDDPEAVTWLLGKSISDIRTDPSTKKTLSTAAIAGTIIGAITSVIILAVGVWQIVLRHKRRPGQSSIRENENFNPYGRPELEGAGNAKRQFQLEKLTHKHELIGSDGYLCARE